jgi:hypothetical protein
MARDPPGTVGQQETPCRCTRTGLSGLIQNEVLVGSNPTSGTTNSVERIRCAMGTSNPIQQLVDEVEQKMEARRKILAKQKRAADKRPKGVMVAA